MSGNKIATVGNPETMNLNNILYQNIIASPYFKGLYDYKTYHEVLDEIAKHEPFLKGSHPSTAFCLLYKLWTLRLTVKQLTGMLYHKTNGHLRAMALLYLRYVLEPSQLWEWFEEFFEDDTEIEVEGGARPKSMTIAKICRILLTDQKWLGTMLPRIPVPIARDILHNINENYPDTKSQQAQRGRDDNFQRDDRDRRSPSPGALHNDHRDRSFDRRDSRRYRSRSRSARRHRSRSPDRYRKDDRRNYDDRRDDDRRRSYDDRYNDRRR